MVRHGSWVICLLVACAPPAASEGPRDGGVANATAGPAASKSGKRIKYLRWMSTDGTAGPEVARDTMLGLDCTWLPVAQDEYRCLPRDRVLYYPVRFADASCQRPVFTFRRSRVCDEPPAYLYTPSTALSCPASFRLSRRGEKLVETSYYARTSNGACGATPVPIAPSEELYDFGESLPEADFVAATPRTGPVKNHFAFTYLDGEDGSSVHYRFRDLGGGFECLTSTAADGEQRCLPNPAGWVDVFQDRACSIPGIAGIKHACQDAGAFAWKTRPDRCGARQEVFRPGPRLALGFHQFSDGCNTSTASRFLQYHEVGEEVDPATFALIKRSVLDPSKRLSHYTITTPAGSYTSPALRDTKLDGDCTFYRLSDGTLRCVPSQLGVDLDLFADDQCSRPVALGDGPDCPVAYAYRAVPESCPEQLRIVSLEPEIHDGPVFVSRDGTCKPADVRTTDGPPVFQPIGRELLPDEFVEFRPPP